jgi:hypothetical protein
MKPIIKYLPIKIATFVLFAMFSFQVDTLIAGNPGFVGPISLFSTHSELSSLAPVLPKEATFEESAEAGQDVWFESIVPLTPAEATFDDDPGLSDSEKINDIAPVPPVEAGFDY